MKNIFALLTIFALFAPIQNVKAQVTSAKNDSPFPVKYRSLIDEKIIIKTLTLAPVYDNVQNIYAKPIQKLLVELLQTDKVWGYSEFPDFNKNIFIEKFDENPNDVTETLVKADAQGLLTAYITKGPRGLNAKLKLFSQDQGLLLLEESFQDLNTFEISKLREKFVEMYANIKNKLPYRGYVLSRRGLEVTLNLGSINGLQTNQQISLAQIIKLNRHPKLKILIGVEKEIIAKILITKVETYLSFAKIIFEKETGVVDVGAKVLTSEYVAYPKAELNTQGEVIRDLPAEDLSSVPSYETPFNEQVSNEAITEKKSDLLDRNNSLGLITAKGILSQYSESDELTNGASTGASQNFAPGLYLGAQLNLPKNLFLDINTQFNIFSANNKLANSAPLTLSYQYSNYTGLVGYNYNFKDQAESEEDLDDDITLSGALGLSQHNTTVSQSTPTSTTSSQTQFVLAQIKASMPLNTSVPITIGGQFDFALSSSFSESPVNSGSGKPSLTSFGLFGIYTNSDRLRTKLDLGITNIATTFNNAGATRAPAAGSNKKEIMNLMLGAEYLF